MSHTFNLKPADCTLLMLKPCPTFHLSLALTQLQLMVECTLTANGVKASTEKWSVLHRLNYQWQLRENTSFYGTVYFAEQHVIVYMYRLIMIDCHSSSYDKLSTTVCQLWQSLCSKWLDITYFTGDIETNKRTDKQKTEGQRHCIKPKYLQVGAV